MKKISLKKRLLLLGLEVFIVFSFSGLFAQPTENSTAMVADLKFTTDLEYLASTLRDPFETYIIPKPPDQPVIDQPIEPLPDPGRFERLEVSGIFWGASFPQAIIDGKVYKEGQSIEGVVIKRIDKDGIILLSGGREYKLNPPALSKTNEDSNNSRGGER